MLSLLGHEKLPKSFLVWNSALLTCGKELEFFYASSTMATVCSISGSLCCRGGHIFPKLVGKTEDHTKAESIYLWKHPKVKMLKHWNWDSLASTASSYTEKCFSHLATRCVCWLEQNSLSFYVYMFECFFKDRLVQLKTNWNSRDNPDAFWAFIYWVMPPLLTVSQVRLGYIYRLIPWLLKIVAQSLQSGWGVTLWVCWTLPQPWENPVEPGAGVMVR